MKKVAITSTYDEGTRLLTTTVSMDGFIADLPAQVVSGGQVDTLTLFSTDAVQPTDLAALQLSVSRAVVAANVQLNEWLLAKANKDKSDLLPETPLDGGEPVP